MRPPEPELLEEWEQAWAQKTEPWARDVVSIERVRSGKALRLVRLGHNVLDNAGKVREQISPYWVAMEHYDAFLGHPDVQALTVPSVRLPLRSASQTRSAAAPGGRRASGWEATLSALVDTEMLST